MSGDLLKALGRAAREERAEAEATPLDPPPLDELGRERMTASALQELSGTAKDEVRRPSLDRRRLAIVAAIVLAATIALFFGLKKPALPAYELSVQGGTSEWRGDEAAPRDRIQVRGDGMVAIVVRPEQPVAHALEARAFATRGAVAKVLPIETSAQGVVRVAGTADALFGPTQTAAPDEWRVVIVIGLPGEMPTSVAAARTRDDLRRFELTVVVSAK
jgi:hypothetical protein